MAPVDTSSHMRNCKRFIADAMLGKLVKWLRVMGVDVEYDPSTPDHELLRFAVQEGRILLTRDRRLVQRRGIPRHLLIDSDYYHEQVRQVVQAFDLERGIRAFTRCLRCNTPLRELPKAAAAAQVPPYVYSTQAEFKWCWACDRVYWGGTHRENMLRQLGVILGQRKGMVVLMSVIPSTLELTQEVRELSDAVIALRRTLHQWPELGFQEERTAALVADSLRSHGLEVKTGLARTGVVGILRGAREGKTVLLRADMDGLPIHEASGVPYSSQNAGVMHACGHDGHTAILLTVARLLARQREQLTGTVKFAFQPAEELPPGGARGMIAEGVLEDPRVDAVFGLHLWNGLPVGRVGVEAGPIMASVDRFDVVVKGVGSHGAYPHMGVDPIVVGSQIITALQTVVSREMPPLAPVVVTVGRFQGGTAFNVIPSTAELSGTVRTVDAQLRQSMPERLERIVRGVGVAMRADCDFTYDFGYPVTVNDAAMAGFVQGVAAGIVGEANVVAARMTMGAEDMSYFLEAAPGCYIRLGSGNAERGLIHPHHSALFDFDESALPLGVELLSRVTLAFLHERS